MYQKAINTIKYMSYKKGTMNEKERTCQNSILEVVMGKKVLKNILIFFYKKHQ